MIASVRQIKQKEQEVLRRMFPESYTEHVCSKSSEEIKSEQQNEYHIAEVFDSSAVCHSVNQELLWREFASYFNMSVLLNPVGSNKSASEFLRHKAVRQLEDTYFDGNGSVAVKKMFGQSNGSVTVLDAVLFLRNLRVDNDATHEELMMVDQRDQAWFDARACRITASNFGNVNGSNESSRSGANNHNKLLKQLLWSDTFQGNVATEHGVVHESVALELYYEYKRACIATNEALSKNNARLVVTTPGFAVCRRYPWMGGSPDLVAELICDDPAAAAKWLGEIKCPFPNSFKGTPAKLYPSIPHQYYDQIQGLMAILELPYCDFIVWTKENTSIERFMYDKEYFERRLFPALQNFYVFKFLPRLIMKKKGLLERGEIDEVLMFDFAS